LTDERYSNVSGGQVVEVTLDEEGACVFRAAVNCEARYVDGEDDLVFLGGVVHVIDTVLVSSDAYRKGMGCKLIRTWTQTPPLPVLATVAAAPLPHFIDLMSLAVLNTNFSPHILNAIQHIDTTHFIVNSATVSENAADIVSSPAEVIRMINYNHIPGYALYSPSLTNGSSFKTAAGVNVTVTTGFDGSVWINDAKIVQTDLLVSNGVVHVVDKVCSCVLAILLSHGLTTGKVLNASLPDLRPGATEVLATQSNHVSSSRDLPTVATVCIIVGALLAAIAALVGATVVHFRRGQTTRFEGHNLTGGARIVPHENRAYQLRSSATPPIHELAPRRTARYHELPG
jgi:uncharacterized surface protein with fasciclin (FAS1) repeats